MGGVGNEAAEKDWRWDLNPGMAAMQGRTTRLGMHRALGVPLPRSLGSQKARCSSDAELFLSSLEKCRTDLAGRKGVKGLLLVGQEKVPCGFGFTTGDRRATQLMVLGTEGGLLAEHGLLRRTRGYLSHGLLFLFLQ